MASILGSLECWLSGVRCGLLIQDSGIFAIDSLGLLDELIGLVDFLSDDCVDNFDSIVLAHQGNLGVDVHVMIPWGFRIFIILSA
jgi:hypothetical protein